MPVSDTLKRLARLEARRNPLERTRSLALRKIHPRFWSDIELESFCAAECPDLKHLSDAELEALALEPYDDLAG